MQGRIAAEAGWWASLRSLACQLFLPWWGSTDVQAAAVEKAEAKEAAAVEKAAAAEEAAALAQSL